LVTDGIMQNMMTRCEITSCSWQWM